MEVLGERFEVHAAVAEGGMGVVHVGLDRTTGKRVAIKRLLRPDEELVRRLRREGEILETLDHPAIVGLIAHGTDTTDRPYVVMRWLEGEVLAATLERGPLSVEGTLGLARTLAEALAYVHAHGLVHRDLKPSNVFLLEGELGAARLIDFGIARTLGGGAPRMTQTGVWMGTPGYVAPEQARGESNLTGAVDVFSLGCVLFECLTGRPAFVASHAMALLAKVLLEEVADVRVLRPDVPEKLARVVAAMTRKDPVERLADGGAVLRALDVGVSLRSSSSAVRERRIRSVLVARPARVDPGAATLVADEPTTIRDSADHLGLDLERLPDGSFVARARAAHAGDEAVTLARLAERLRHFDGSVAIASGQQVERTGEAIERAFDLVGIGRRDILLDENCAAFLEARWEVDPIGGCLCLGKERSVADDARRLLGKATPCVGRDRELTILEATVREAMESGEPRVVLVTGPSGTGKSRLRHELVHRLDTKSFQCRAEALDAAVPYRLATAIARQVGSVALPPREAAFLAELLGASATPPPEVLAARARPDAHFDGVQAAFVALMAESTGDEGAVLVLDDLQWCDPMSARLLDLLARDVGRPLVVVALARPEVRKVLPQLWTTRDVLEVKLPPLPRRAAERLVRGVLSEVTADDLRRIVDRSEGNAFFLEELVRAAAARTLDRLPETVLALAQSRLDALPEEARTLLRHASVFDGPFSDEAIAALSGLPDVPRILAELVGSEALLRLPDERHAFRHALLREASYSTLSDDERVTLHARLARWSSAEGEPSELVAHHFLRAGDVRSAAEALAHAAASWAQQGRLEAAARVLAVSLWLAPSADGSLERWTTLADHVRVSRSVVLEELPLASELPVAPVPDVGFVVQLLDRARTVLPAAQARALRGTFVEILAACSAYDEARRMLADTPTDGLTAAEERDLLVGACELHNRTGDFRRVREVVARLLPLLDDDPPRRLRVLLGAVIAEASLVGPGGRDAVLALLTQADEVIARLGPDPSLRTQRAKCASFVEIYTGTFDEMTVAGEAHVREARAAGLRYELMVATHNLADSILLRGEPLDVARELLEESLALARTFRTPRMILHDEGILAVLDLRAGDGAALERAERARTELLSRGERWDGASLGLQLGRALVAIGDRATGQRVLDATREVAEALGMPRFIEWCQV